MSTDTGNGTVPDASPGTRPGQADLALARPNRFAGLSIPRVLERHCTDTVRRETTMKFMFTIYHDERVLEALPEAEMQALVDSALDYDETIRRSGHYIVSNALQPARTARTLRVRDGKVLVTDGPFAET